MTVSIRSYLAAGVATAAVGAIAIAPIEQTAAQTMGARLYQLTASVQSLIQPANAAAAALGAIGSSTPVTPNSAAATITAAPAAAVSAVPAAAAVSSASIPTPPPLIWPSDSLLQSAGDAIINIYNAFEPWFQWGWSVVAWAAGWVPIVGFFAQQINIAYATVEPIVGALVYSFAYLIDGQADLIPQILSNGVSAAWNNFIQGEVAWFESFLPPLPPIGSVFGAAATPAATPLVAAAVEAPTEAAASGVAGFKHAPEGVSSDVDSAASGASTTVEAAAVASPTVVSSTATDPTAPDSTITESSADQAGTSDEATVAAEATTDAPAKLATDAPQTSAPETSAPQTTSSTSVKAGDIDSASTDKTADKSDTSKSGKSGGQKSTGHSKARSAAKSGSN